MVTNPSDWTTGTVNSVANKYWIRISTSSDPVTTGKAYSILPYNSVPSLLALTSQDLQDESWAWCEYTIPGTGARPYVTIRNTGDAVYEGDWYVSSSSTTANKQSFFRFNHAYKGNFLNSAYDYSSGSQLVVQGIRKTVSRAPSSGASGQTGEIEWDTDYVYVCVATNSWKRAALSYYA